MSINIVKKILEKINSANIEKIEFYGKNNRAAGKRYRRLMSEIRTLATIARDDVQKVNRERGNLTTELKLKKGA